MITKKSKLVWIFVVLILILIGFYNYQLNTAREESENLKKLYQAKNNSGFLTLLRQGHSVIPLAETLEQMSKVTDQEDPAKVQKFIERAKSQADEATQFLITLVEFSDNYVNDTAPQFMVNQTVMTSKEQEDLFILAMQADVFRIMYEVSYSYWKDKPKLIPQKTKNTFASIAKELRAMDDTLLQFKEMAAHELVWGQFATTEQLKILTMRTMKPHFEELIKTMTEFRE